MISSIGVEAQGELMTGRGIGVSGMEMFSVLRGDPTEIQFYADVPPAGLYACRTMRRSPSILPTLSLLTLLLLPAALAGQGADSLLGTRPPEWEVTHWLGSEPLSLAGLAGRVVLVRWWTGPGCPFCRASAPALADFHAAYAERGLVVVGLYHHKAPTPLDPEAVATLAGELGFTFPVAVDPGWRTLRRWWLDRVDSNWTSVSFLLDRDGLIRHIHPGGQYVRGDGDYEALEAKIEELLATR